MPLSKNGTAYEITGPEGAPVVVLIHGLGMTYQSTWGGMGDAFSARYRVLNYDLCGHGASALPSEPPGLTVLAEQLIGLMDELDIRQATLIGFSLGGMINRRVAMDHPERVAALVILNSPHERSAEAQKLVENRARDSSQGGPEAVIDANLERWLTPEFHAKFSDQVKMLRDVVLANDHQNYARHRRVLAEGVIELIRPDPPIQHPTLVMTCENDTGSTPEMSRTIASEIEGAQVIIVPDLKHLGLVEKPIYFANQIIDFLCKNKD